MNFFSRKTGATALSAQAYERLQAAFPTVAGWVPEREHPASAPTAFGVETTQPLALPHPPDAEADAEPLASHAPAVSSQARFTARAVVGLGLCILLGLLAGCYYLWRARPHEVQAPIVSTTTSMGGVPAGAKPVGKQGKSDGVPATDAVAASPGSAPNSATVLVHVVGQVRRPGVVSLPAGARVNDAVAAAGGATARADLSLINLANLLADGEQIRVPAKGDPAPPPRAPTAPTAGATPTPTAVGAASPADAGDQVAVVDLNTATLEQLDGLPGVGPVLAQRILDWRQSHGKFSSVDELREVSGIGERKFADIAARVRV